MLPSFPQKIVPRKVIAVAVLVAIALLTGLVLARQNSNNPNLRYTPMFAATATTR